MKKGPDTSAWLKRGLLRSTRFKLAAQMIRENRSLSIKARIYYGGELTQREVNELYRGWKILALLERDDDEAAREFLVATSVRSIDLRLAGAGRKPTRQPLADQAR